MAPAQGTDSIDLAANLRNVPWFEMSSEQDLDAGATDARKMYSALSDLGYDAQLLVYDTKIHEYSSIYDTLPDIFTFFAAHQRNANPAEIAWTQPVGESRPELGLVYDGAYWLDRVRAVDRNQSATVEVASGGIPHLPLDPQQANRSESMVNTNGPSGRSAGTLLRTVPAFGPQTGRSNSPRADGDERPAPHPQSSPCAGGGEQAGPSNRRNHPVLGCVYD